MAEKIVDDWFVCAMCGIETSGGFEHLQKKYCTACFKKVKEQLNKEVKGGKV